MKQIGVQVSPSQLVGFRVCFAAALTALLCVRADAASVAPTYFVAVDGHDDRFVFELTNPDQIEQARRLVGDQKSGARVAGTPALGDGGYNRDVGTDRRWSWHLVPDTIWFPDGALAEALETSVGGVETSLDYWLRLGVCAIGARIESEGLVYRPGQFMNQSARAWVGSGDDVQIAGFVVRGTEKKTFLIRAGAPALVPLGVSSTLADPVLEIHDQKTGLVIATNDNWSDDPVTADGIEVCAARVGAFPWVRGSRDAAILLALDPGIYTAVVRGKDNGTGNALLELYNGDDPTGTRMINISARSQTKGGDDLLIAGFVVSGVQPKRVLIRAAGPALTAQGVSGVLADPQLEIYDQRSGKRIYFNDDWDKPERSDMATLEEIEAAVKSVGAVPWARDSKDAAMVVLLAPGIYTALVRGANNNPGVSLVEVYEMKIE